MLFHLLNIYIVIASPSDYIFLVMIHWYLIYHKESKVYFEVVIHVD